MQQSHGYRSADVLCRVLLLAAWKWHDLVPAQLWARPGFSHSCTARPAALSQGACMCVCVFASMCIYACVCVCYCCTCALTRQENLNRAGRLTSHRDLIQMHHLQSSGTVGTKCAHTKSWEARQETLLMIQIWKQAQVSDYHQCLIFSCLVHHPVMKCRACSCVTASSSDEVRKITKNTNNFTTSKIAAWQVYTCSMTSLFSMAAWQVYTCTCPWSACSCNTAITL